MLSDRIEELARLYEAARKPGIADWDYRDFMVRVVDDWPVILPVLRAAVEYASAKRELYVESCVTNGWSAALSLASAKALAASERLVAAVEEAGQ